MSDFHEVWRQRPDLFFKDVLGVETLEPYQKKILLEVAQYDKVAIRAAHSLGKTWSFARIALWFFSCYRNSLVITTAPTFKQVDSLLWGELRDAYKNSKMAIGGKLLRTKLEKSDKWFCLGLSPQRSAGTSEEQQGSSFQGYHSDHIMVIFDEATGIDPDVWKMAQGLLTSGKTVKFVAIANPTTRACEFYKCFSKAGWRKLSLSCFDSPNLIENNLRSKDDLELEIERLCLLSEDDRLEQIANYKKPAPHLVTAQFVVDFVMEWGMDHPLTVSKAFGEFPENDESVLIKLNYVNEAIKRDCSFEENELRCIGVDVARYGSDKSVITEIIGVKQTDLVAIAKRSTTEVTGHIIRMINGENSGHRTVVLVDATGIGAGVMDNLVEQQQSGTIPKEVDILEIHFGASPVNPEETDKEVIEQDKARYSNLKAKMFQLLSNDLRDCLDIFDDSNFLKELPTIKSSPDSRGRLKIESKDDYKKRTGRSSPDFSDSLALCNLGRYVNINFGSFKNLQNKSIQPIVRQPDRRVGERKSRIKISSY